MLLDPNGAGGPTLSWGLPNVAHDAVAVRVRDNTVRVGPGQLPCSTLGNSACVADLLSVNYFPAGTTSIAIPGALYQPGKDYSIEINVIDLRGSYIASGPGRNGLMFADTQRMSRSYIDAAVLPSGAPAAYLPTPFLLPDGAPAYSFQIGGIVNGQPIFIDPLIAIGYDYAVGAGDPFFASVLLPTGIGDDLYDIIVDNISYSVMGGVVFDFTQIAAGGVDAFRVLGIELTQCSTCLADCIRDWFDLCGRWKLHRDNDADHAVRAGVVTAVFGCSRAIAADGDHSTPATG